MVVLQFATMHALDVITDKNMPNFLVLSLQIEAIRKDMKQKEQVEEAYKDAGEDGQGGAEDNLDDDAKIAEDEEGGE